MASRGASRSRRLWLVIGAVLLLALGAVACGDDSSDGGSSGSTSGGSASGKKPIYVLYYSDKIIVWPKYLLPAAREAIKKEFPSSPIVEQSADLDQAKQLAQAEAAVSKGAGGVFLAAADPAQAGSVLKVFGDAKVPVVAYAQEAYGGPLAAFNSNNPINAAKGVGKYMSENVVKDVGHSPVRVALIYGDPTFSFYPQFKEGFSPWLDKMVKDGSAKVVCESDAKAWDPTAAQTQMEQCLTKTNNGVDVVVTMQDSTASGAWAGLKSAGLNGKVQLYSAHVGDVPAIQRVLAGEQVPGYLWDAFSGADASAKMLKAAMEGKPVTSTGVPNGPPFDNKFVEGGVPQYINPVLLVTKDNVDERFVKRGLYTKKEICTGIAAKSAYCTGG